MISFRKLVQRTFGLAGLRITSHEHYSELLNKVEAGLISNRKLDDLNSFLNLKLNCQSKMTLIKLLNESNSQLNQDIFAAYFSGFKIGGFFVEFGACDGIEGSNTFLLEKRYLWDGILCEPAKQFNKYLELNRRVKIDRRAVTPNSGDFVKLAWADVNSTLIAEDQVALKKQNFDVVETISLIDLLHFHSAPKVIDYLSIDTEGGELEILRSFDFNEYHFGFISVEHNYRGEDLEMDYLLGKFGYVRILKSLSKFDAWYIPEKHVDLLEK